MELKVNGQVMQKDSTTNMIWTVREQVAYLSTIVTLEPGDVIATGTPTGVGMAARHISQGRRRGECLDRRHRDSHQFRDG